VPVVDIEEKLGEIELESRVATGINFRRGSATGGTETGKIFFFFFRGVEGREIFKKISQIPRLSWKGTWNKPYLRGVTLED